MVRDRVVVSAERPGLGRQEVADAASASSPFLTEHADIIGWLDVLLKGKSEDQARARTEIGMILEARGFSDDAEEAYWTNVQSGAADRRAYDRLIVLYQNRKDRLSESLVRRKLEDVFNRPAGATPLASGTTASAPGAGSLAMPVGLDQAARPVRRLRSAGATPKGLENPRLGTVASAQAAAPAPAPSQPRPAPAAQPAGPAPRPGMPRPAGRPPVPTAVAPAPLQAFQDDDDAVPAELVAPGRSRRRATLLPNPGRSRFHFNTNGLIVLQPMTIAAFLLASFGAAAIISMLILSFDRGSVKTANASTLQAPARCVDGAGRFPGANDPRAAVAAAYKQQGVDVDAPRQGGPRLTPEQAELVIGGWMATSLLLEQGGQSVPTLAQWLDPTSDKATLANAILSGRGLDSMLTPEEWLLMRNWPASTCGGGFVQDPRNQGLVRMIERVVSK